MNHCSIVMNAAIKAVMLFGVLSGSVEGPGNVESRGLVERGDGSVIEDPNKAMSLFAWTERKKERKIPDVLLRIIAEYSDFNEIKEIRTLFQMLPRGEDRMGVLGFESYEAMDHEYPCIADKVSYLKSLERDFAEEVDDESISSDGCEGGDAIRFDGYSVVGIDWRKFTNEDLGTLPYKNPQAINWGVINQFHNLLSLDLHGLELDITMSDLAQLPSTLRFLDISNSNWQEPSGDVDLGKLPLGLTELIADSCEGMTGYVGLLAPHSKLKRVDLSLNELIGICNVTNTPPQLTLLDLTENEDFQFTDVSGNDRRILENQYNCSLEEFLGWKWSDEQQRWME